MKQVAGHHGADWMMQNGELHILHPDYCLPGEASGMLGSPKHTDRELEVSCLLRPEITVGSMVRVESIVADYGGAYKTVAVKSEGDTHASRWGSRLRLVNGKFKQPRTKKKMSTLSRDKASLDSVMKAAAGNLSGRLGVLFTTVNPLNAAQIGAYPKTGGNLNEESSVTVISNTKNGNTDDTLYSPMFRVVLKGR